MSKLKCGLIQMSLKGDGTMPPEKIRDLMIEAHIPMLEDAAKPVSYTHLTLPTICSV